MLTENIPLYNLTNVTIFGGLLWFSIGIADYCPCSTEVYATISVLGSAIMSEILSRILVSLAR
jgi:hypothetical protein